MPDGEGTDRTFCVLLWVGNGGSLNAKGEPTIAWTEDLADIEGEPSFVPARGNCTRSYDCNECQYMQQELAKHPPELVSWVCPACIGVVSKTAKANGVKIQIPGHFAEGYCGYKHCTRPSRAGVESPDPGPGFSRFLQLVIGPINQ